MSEAELTVKEKNETIYISVKRQSPAEEDWPGILEDLESLNWLAEDNNTSELISAVWTITDKNAAAAIEGRKRFRLLKLSRVKVFVTTVAHNITSLRDDVKEICSLCKKHINDFGFFAKANSYLKLNLTDIGEAFTKVIEVYEDTKNQLTSSLIHLDKSYSLEVGKGIGKALDEQLYIKVISPNRVALNDEDSITALLSKYSAYPTASRQTSTFYPTYPYTTYQRDSVYLGELSEDNKREGFGKCTYYNGDIYEGFWSDDRPAGRGVYIWKDGGRYEGEFNDGRMHGKGKRVFASGSVYEGDFEAGKKHGTGTLRFKNGDSYSGSWDYDDMSGDGVYTWHTGDKFTGKFRRDKREGLGTLTLESGEEITGEWVDGKMKQPTNI